MLDSALSQVPVLGEEIRSNIQGLRGSTSALVTGILGSLYGGTGVAQAGQNAMHTMWAVPIHRRPNPIGSRLKSLVAVLALGGGLVGTTGLSGLAASVEAGGLGAGVRDAQPQVGLDRRPPGLDGRGEPLELRDVGLGGEAAPRARP